MKPDREDLFRQLLDCRSSFVRGIGGMEALLHADLTMAQLKSLVLLAQEGGSTVSQVADGLGVGRPAASLLVDRLVQLGLVHRWEDSQDRRRTLVELTPEGQKLASELYEGSRQQMEALVSQLSDEDLQALVQGMSALAAVVRRTSPLPSAPSGAAS